MVDAALDVGGLVHDHLKAHPGQFFFQLLYGLFYLPRHLHGVGAALFLHVNREGGAAVNPAELGGLFKGVLHAGHVAQVHRGALRAAHHHLRNFVGAAELPGHPHQDVLFALLHLAGGNVGIFRLQGLHQAV